MPSARNASTNPVLSPCQPTTPKRPRLIPRLRRNESHLVELRSFNSG